MPSFYELDDVIEGDLILDISRVFWIKIRIAFLWNNQSENQKLGLTRFSWGRRTPNQFTNSMGAFLDKPKTEKTNDHGEGPGYRYVVASMQGWRWNMEDAHQVKVAITEEEPLKHWSFFAVFDGHAGCEVANHSAENLLAYLLNTEEFKQLVPELKKNEGKITEKAIQLLKDGIKAGFLKLDEHMSTEKGPDGEEKEKSGTTATCAILTPEYVFFCNLGDSRGLLGRKTEEVFYTVDHKPYLTAERERIIRAGGTVMIQRVNGSLAVSRALGDFEYKNVPGLTPTEQLVSPEPDVYVIKRNPDEDEFLILACDGIYDVLENEELCVLLRSRLTVTDDLKKATNQVLDYCLARGSRDNMTMVAVIFEAAPKKNPEASKAEEEWLDKVREKAKEYADRFLKEVREVETNTIISYLKANTDLERSPVYGGLDLAKHVIDDVIDRTKRENGFTSDSEEHSMEEESKQANVVLTDLE
ncbi:unnamed protein product [Bursaphelenchus xylophilus]|uniref:(pine wood nematode) hypothetical protein n=1 Tax=Bursaphelenchus xylophilus TaxID=6326 RepID=A0A1I7RSP4_BURXY|nr:unnamed protein product [Bursaphelenchus xylophilus]CAG9122847.1 unnamed protein product [Bursaphelenchus xylophilus]